MTDTSTGTFTFERLLLVRGEEVFHLVNNDVLVWERGQGLIDL